MNTPTLGEERLSSFHRLRRFPVHIQDDRPFDEVSEILAGMAMPRGRNARRNLSHRRHPFAPRAWDIAALQFSELGRGWLGTADGDDRHHPRPGYPPASCRHGNHCTG
jgi:hypothetical protein